MSGYHGGTATASRAACVHILTFYIVEEQSAIAVYVSYVNSFSEHDIADDAVSLSAEVACQYHIKIIGAASRIPEIPCQRVYSCGSHRRPHIVYIGYAFIDNASGKNFGYLNIQSRSR